MSFVLSARAAGGIDDVEARIVAALKEVGFGILTRIEVNNVLREKLGVETSPYRILGACNPTLAHEALSRRPEVGVFLPCSVCLRQEADGTVSIWALNPGAVVETLQDAELSPQGARARELIENAIGSVT
ncbi:DUF302 domain-containing protein [candidate division KSB1 bacterium]|nr:DUF302 domain-containing protein [candidate division KSB1 bacterium]